VRTALSGALERTVNVGQGPVAFALDEQRGHIFVQTVAYSSSSSASGSVSMLDASSGALLGTARVGAPNPFAQYLIGGTPQTLVVDEQNGHVLAANSATMGANGAAIAHNSVSVLAAHGRTLTVLHTIALSAAPVAIATDSLTAHAFVITTMMSSAGPSKPGVSMLDLRTGTVVGVVSL
jgi:DNA-binding beta-propeller fold protein YncE